MALPEGFLPDADIPAPLHEALGEATERLDDALCLADRVAQAKRSSSEADADADIDAEEMPSATWLALSNVRRAELARVVALSDFATETLARDPGWLPVLDAEGELDESPSRETWEAELAERLEAAEDEAAMQAAIRRFRRLRMLGIVWRDLCRAPRGQGDEAGMWGTARDVSSLAEICLDGALGWLEDYYAPRWGQPALRADGTPQRLVVLGMGKLGAGELNLSSDIDLIFAFAEEGETQGGRRALSHQEYFTKLGQKLIGALDAVTDEGMAFRVDMRLRPLGDGGPLVGNFATLASYYQDQGREWERYAMLKARPVAGDLEAGAELLASLRPFVYRKYLDFGAIESLREMKRLINREVKRKGMADNIKLGPGGIREVEFVVQAFQLIRGGRDTELQLTSLAAALRCLTDLELLPGEVTDALRVDYAFLRDLEHALQAQKDRQTQTLPEDSLGRERLALALDMADWPALVARLDEARGRVREHFDAVIAPPEEEDDEQSLPEDASREELGALWREELTPDEARETLTTLGCETPEATFKRLASLHRSRAVAAMQRIGFERLDALMPLLLEAAGESRAPDVALERVLPLIEAVLRRTAYLALLRENPDALRQLIRLCAASPWIAEQLARHPVLLDELLHPATLYSPADKDELADELRQALARIPEDDEEGQLDALRIFKHAQVLHVAASDIVGARPLMKVSDYLTFIAEVILEQILAMAWKQVTRKYGRPSRHPGEHESDDANFAIIGYGKLGGIELGYGSDLDLVFLHDADPKGVTDGAKALDNAVFFTRLGQRIIHLLTAMTPSGALYEVDMRLRPSGNAGLLVTTLDAFADYQHQQAWTWEHQALVRSRAIAGNTALCERFEVVRREVLSQPREPEQLRESVVAMRRKMRTHLGSSDQAGRRGTFHLKQDPGGMVDIEFLCQYAVLRLGDEAPEMLAFSDNMRILETLEESGRLPAEQARELREAYLTYRGISHRASLAKAGSQVDIADIDDHRRRVRAIWAQWMQDDDASR
ncbi:bifunctional [glutamate--ammonia ligase]-adenylyl-L-tyrosine phosphorylase/[glutamate--ammonia-ligase] adenylyltransferase [Chromohalobacter canadensis]|uniref:Bifunctional glutamine synthetase adenylyltransferase/adenylyl-removing enzyme n=1 Tax=Chromohalobacter canadensis TaxID=141389 RepID=A0ABZ0YEI8_9GAMM|nr:bifunctional [glutamate--ammonia ligase]-adenylyl-L-tyrosine phosphorylase/[glutamate--ammonia-ligase] adenylyltransferase [Chromohalobacter canadensis]MCK0767246.1 bifunctional [glutamate--ammonia ligase]-adenylyl-L-tyrosine phosphorylase/[glutamate--ammonia-ligase] adenylyltransferase [Chromohalobacter canadensis]WQH10149.1 bifunctional [glutamate--ammonia ligase]-adenylyl-L-tyrosine phosphorylase/[glutamate--ammonia-ligase] adenylyltransferase [Chromohalobacter canadensis]